MGEGNMRRAFFLTQPPISVSHTKKWISLIVRRSGGPPRRQARFLVHPGAVRGVRRARTRLPRGEAVYVGGPAHAVQVPPADFLGGPVGLQQAPLPSPRSLRILIEWISPGYYVRRLGVRWPFEVLAGCWDYEKTVVGLIYQYSRNTPIAQYPLY